VANNPTVIPYTEGILDLTALVAMSAPWAGGKIKLFKSPVALTPNLPYTSLIEADFTGYAESAAVVWGTPFYLANGVPCVTSDLKIFTVGSTPTILNTIYGYYLVNSGGTDYIFARTFDTPIVLTQAGQSIQLVASYPSYGTP
jgi:hypothetical protein